MSDVTIKITDRTDTRRFTVPTGTPYATIRQRASLAFGLDVAIKLKYTDDEGDLITVSTDSELADAIAHTTTPENLVLHLTLEVTSHTASHLATRTTAAAAAHVQPAAQPSATVAQSAITTLTTATATVAPSSADIVKDEGTVPPMPLGAFVKEEEAVVNEEERYGIGAAEGAVIKQDPLGPQPQPQPQPQSAPPTQPATAAATATATSPPPLLPSLPPPASSPQPSTSPLPPSPPAVAAPAGTGRKRKLESVDLLEVVEFLENLPRVGGKVVPPPGWESEMVDRKKPYVPTASADGTNKTYGTKTNYRVYWGPNKEGQQLTDKEAKPVLMKTVRNAWLFYSGFAHSEKGGQRLTTLVKKHKAAVAEAAGAPGPSSDNDVDDEQPPLLTDGDDDGAPAVGGASALHIEEMD